MIGTRWNATYGLTQRTSIFVVIGAAFGLWKAAAIRARGERI